MTKDHRRIFCLLLFVYFFPNRNCLVTNPAIGILTQSNIYIAQIQELNYTTDDLALIYHHTDPVYFLQSFTSNNLLNRIYVCSPNTIYSLDLRVGTTIVPLLPVDDTPCHSSLTYIGSDTSLLWALHRTVIQFDFTDMSKEILWNSTSPILDMIQVDTTDDDYVFFYISITLNTQQSAILHCRADRLSHLYPFQSCLFIDSSYHHISALAIDDNRLYVADRTERRIYVLTLLPNGFVRKRDLLPLNTSTVADVQSMFIYDSHLIWSTTSGHVRTVSLITYEVRNLFWFDQELRAVQLVSFAQWPNRTTTTKRTTEQSTTTSTQTITTTSQSSTVTLSSTSAADPVVSTTDDHINNIDSPWKATTFVTSIILGVALFLCAAMITCVLLNYRLGRVVPNSFTNIFHILRNRSTTTTPPAVIPTILDESMT